MVLDGFSTAVQLLQLQPKGELFEAERRHLHHDTKNERGLHLICEIVPPS
jgi:t-SNARE complex subunit (syntaxin)